MMKRMLLMAAGLLVMLTACDKEKPENGGTTTADTSKIVGEWSLTGISTKAATLGGQTISVYVSFSSDNKFQLYQQIGQGWYTYYSGSWTLKDGTLSGTYDSGAAWGSTYTVALDGDTMSLTSAGGSETDTYTRTSIPAEVKNKTWVR
mgnify:CR=1 FL=1